MKTAIIAMLIATGLSAKTVKLDSNTAATPENLIQHLENKSVGSLELAPLNIEVDVPEFEYKLPQVEWISPNINELADNKKSNKRAGVSKGTEKKLQDSLKHTAGRKVFFLWGGLEEHRITTEFNRAIAVMNTFRRAGWTVVTDRSVSAAEADSYFSDKSGVGYWWGSHGTEDAHLLVSGDGYYRPTKVKTNNTAKIVFLCSCYSKTMTQYFNAKLPEAEVYGFKKPVSDSKCNRYVGETKFIKEFNSSIR